MDLLSQYAYQLAAGFYDFVTTGLDYLRRAILGSPPETRPVGTPYAPPFTGGQCLAAYNISFDLFVERDPVGSSLTYNGITVSGFAGSGCFGPLGPPVILRPTASTWDVQIRCRSYAGTSYDLSIASGSTSSIVDVRITRFAVARADGGSDNCGNLPNPNPSPPIPSDGLAESDPPDFDGANYTPITTGTPLPPDGSEDLIEEAGEELEEAALLAPTDLPGAIAKIALGLARLAELLALINDLIALLKKLFNPGNKSSFSYNYGNLRYDGYIELFPTIRPANITPLYLDLQATTLKGWASRYLGEKSPNYWHKEPIGFIHFASPTMGILSTHEIRFSRTSIPIPLLARGFFYHLGLDGTNRMNSTGFYLKQE